MATTAKKRLGRRAERKALRKAQATVQAALAQVNQVLRDGHQEAGRGCWTCQSLADARNALLDAELELLNALNYSKDGRGCEP